MTRPRPQERAARPPRRLAAGRGRVPGPLALLVVLLVLATSSLVPVVAAQTPSTSSYLQLRVEPLQGFVQVPWKGQADVPVRFVDSSSDRFGNGTAPHIIQVTVAVVTPDHRGWTASFAPTFVRTHAGTSVVGHLTVQAGPAASLATVLVNVTAVMTGQGGVGSITRSTVIQATLLPFQAGSLAVETPPPQLAPAEARTLAVRVTNLGPYPDTFLLTSHVSAGWALHVQPRVSLLPGASEVVPATLVAPGSGYLYQGDVAVLTFDLGSALDPGGFHTSESWSATVQGAHLPGYAVPAVPLTLVLLGLVLTRRVDRRERRRGELGRPRKPRPTRRQRRMLRELKRLDPEAHRRQLARLEAIRRERREAHAQADPDAPLAPLPEPEPLSAPPDPSPAPLSAAEAPTPEELEARLRELRDRLQRMRGDRDGDDP